MKRLEVALIGPPGSGKTSLINAFLSTFDPSVRPNIVANRTSITVEGNNGPCLIEFLDTPGQQNYLQLAKSFLRNIDIVLFCFFDDLDEYDLYNDAISDAIPEKAEKWLIQTKIDIGEQYTVGNEFFDKNFIAQFFKTSALQNIGIEDLLKAIASHEINPIHIPIPIPITDDDSTFGKMKKSMLSFC